MTDEEISAIRGYLLSEASVYQIVKITGEREEAIEAIREELVKQCKLGND